MDGKLSGMGPEGEFWLLFAAKEVSGREDALRGLPCSAAGEHGGKLECGVMCSFRKKEMRICESGVRWRRDETVAGRG